ncbi:uncharacterized protein EI97DRAFT_203081 [Westerdykella ornata]|uniref:Uncharacterized protein n=1 Tax=Westerdykella ornata TaxID=318751 RepID=A0A6A6J7Y2_WESOR|nr:uncharacterized protein EI97DRAFT_203081 [Westerdykella ornata]KAF2272690.1 hypothetical protein EI97DRAFT_203081 [Westerdykella ornata]
MLVPFGGIGAERGRAGEEKGCSTRPLLPLLIPIYNISRTRTTTRALPSHSTPHPSLPLISLLRTFSHPSRTQLPFFHTLTPFPSPAPTLPLTVPPITTHPASLVIKSSNSPSISMPAPYALRRHLQPPSRSHAHSFIHPTLPNLGPFSLPPFPAQVSHFTSYLIRNSGAAIRCGIGKRNRPMRVCQTTFLMPIHAQVNTMHEVSLQGA